MTEPGPLDDSTKGEDRVQDPSVRVDILESKVQERDRLIAQLRRELQETAERQRRVEERTADLVQTIDTLQAEIARTRRIEDQVRQSQRLEAIGTLAGGIAHDFNNLLTVISGYSDILLTTKSDADPDRALLEQINLAGDRAATLTRQLLTFSRRQLAQQKVIELNAVVADAERMLKRVIGADITLTTRLAADLGRIKADPAHLQQVILNLAVNAREAMPDGGKLTIETSAFDLDESSGHVAPGLPHGPYVLLTVADTGCGIDETAKAHIFEPFYTTKEHPQGAGLGLAAVFGIVKQSRGHIWVQSEPGLGTTFTICLPVSTDLDDAELVAVGTSQTLTGTETILLVEDEDSVRLIASAILKMFGYTVLEAAHGHDAIRLCTNHPGPIDLLIADVILPEMGGRKVANAILRLRPQTRVLYLSGYMDDTLGRQGISHEDVRFLHKPFSADVLARKVREVLNASFAVESVTDR